MHVPDGDDPLSIGPTTGAGPSRAVEAAESVTEPTAAGSIDPVGETSADPIGGIAADLESGAISAVEARERIVDAVLAAELPPGLPPAEVEALRQEVAELLVDDPAFAALLGIE